MRMRIDAGFRKLPEASGPKARPRGPAYLVAHACFDCRVSFKRALRQDGTSAHCPNCGNLLNPMGRGFKVPPRKNVEGWSVVARLYQAGFRFPTNWVRANPPLPTRAREVDAFVACNPDHSCRLAQSNYAFKPTAVGVFRSNLPLPCGGGLTRR